MKKIDLYFLYIHYIHYYKKMTIKEAVKFNDRPLLKDLLQKFNYPFENHIFEYDTKLYTKYIVIGKNYENCLVCDWNLLSEEPQENIFKDELFEGGWYQTSDILNVKVEMMSFLDDVGRPKEPKYIAEELWNRLLESNKCIENPFERPPGAR